MRSTVVKKDTASCDIVHGSSRSEINRETIMRRSTVVKKQEQGCCLRRCHHYWQHTFLQMPPFWRSQRHYWQRIIPKCCHFQSWQHYWQHFICNCRCLKSRWHYWQKIIRKCRLREGAAALLVENNPEMPPQHTSGGITGRKLFGNAAIYKVGDITESNAVCLRECNND